MEKLNLYKEIATDMSINPDNYWMPRSIEATSKDWLILYAEIERLNQSLKNAVAEIEGEKTRLHKIRLINIEQGKPTIVTDSNYSTLTLSLDILHKHFPKELEEK